MTLSATVPNDSALVSELPGYIRDVAEVVVDDHSVDIEMIAETTTLAIDSDLSAYVFESVILSAEGACSLASISGGKEGQIKTFVFQDGYVTIVHSASKANGTFYLSPAGVNFSAAQDDVLIMINIGGDGSTVDGYWKELLRNVQS